MSLCLEQAFPFQSMTSLRPLFHHPQFFSAFLLCVLSFCFLVESVVGLHAQVFSCSFSAHDRTISIFFFLTSCIMLLTLERFQISKLVSFCCQLTLRMRQRHLLSKPLSLLSNLLLVFQVIPS